MTRVTNFFCHQHNIDWIFKCESCGRFHICDGAHDCVLIQTLDGMICDLSGSYVMENLQGPFTGLTHENESTSTKEDFHTTINEIYKYIEDFFSNTPGLEEVSTQILTQDGTVQETIAKYIATTFQFCAHFLKEISYGFSLVCSMYTQILISIFATKTVYDPLLFKCTRNKKHDQVLKRVRAAWIST